MQVRTCCECISLRKGTIIIGIWCALLAILSLVIIFTVDIEWRFIIINIENKTVVKVILAINLLMTILISSLLIIGAVKRNTLLMVPWIALGLMMVIAQFVSVIYTSIMFFVNNTPFNGALCLVTGLTSVALYAYMWLVVYSYFQQVRAEKLNGRIDPYGRPYTYRQQP